MLYYDRGATASKTFFRFVTEGGFAAMTVEGSNDTDSGIDIGQSTKGRLGGDGEGGVGQFQFPLSDESGMEISSLGSQIYTVLSFKGAWSIPH